MANSKETFMGIPVAPNFKRRGTRRLRLLQEVSSKSRESSYGSDEHRGGDYGTFVSLRRKSEFSEGGFFPEGLLRKDVYELCGWELFFEKQIKNFLEIKKGQWPVVAMDIGGMVGESWLRLAKRFEKEVRESRVAFVVTNLSYSPEEHFGQETRGYPSELIEMLRGSRDLVIFLKGRISQVRRTTVKLPNGADLPLKGHTDLLHENWSLHYWSFTPELEILQAASLLSPYGTYVIQKNGHETDPGSCTLLGPDIGNLGEQEDRRGGIVIAHEEMKRSYGLIGIDRVEGGDLGGQKICYSDIFRMPAAPPIVVNESSQSQA